MNITLGWDKKNRHNHLEIDLGHEAELVRLSEEGFSRLLDDVWAMFRMDLIETHRKAREAFAEPFGTEEK